MKAFARVGFARPGNSGFFREASPSSKATRKPIALAARLAGVSMLLLAASGASVAAGSQPVYVANVVGGSVSVIDSSTNGVVTTIPVGVDPVSIAVSPDGERVYVANQGSSTVSVIEATSNNVVATVPVPNTLIDVIVAPDGARVYASGTAGVHIIDPATYDVVGQVTMSGYAYAMAVSRSGAQLFVANPIDDVVVVIDTASVSVSATIGAGFLTDPVDVALTPDGNRLYVSNGGANSVSVISTASNEVLETIQFAHPAGPLGLAIAPDGSRAYVALNDGNAVAVIDTSTNTVSATVPVTNPAYPAITPDGARVYVTSPDTDSVSVIDTATDAVLTSTSVGENPVGVASRPVGTCASDVISVPALRSEVDSLATSRQTQWSLNKLLDNITWALNRGNNKLARTRIAEFINSVVDLSNLAPRNQDRIALGRANHLVCGAANVLSGITLP